jgi:hypothetical protein
MMIAIAIIVGFVIVENYSLYLKVVFMLFTLVIFQEWMRYALIASYAPETHPSSLGLYTTIITLVIFAIGIGVGASMGINARRRLREIEEAGASVIEEIDNGGLKKIIKEGGGAQETSL